MNHLSAFELTQMLLALSALLATAKLMGELVRKLGQPPVAGEIAAGILLGPTVLGRFVPQAYAALFPTTGHVAVVIDAIATLSVVFFLLAAGLETRLRNILRQGKRSFLVSFFGGAFPFAVGLACGELFPTLLGAESFSNRHLFGLFLATALSISALPVIAKTLMDLRLLDSEFGALVISSAMFDDLIGWILFGIVMGMVNKAAGASVGSFASSGTLRTVLMVLIFVAFTLTLGRWLIAKALLAIQVHSSGQGAALGFVFSLALASGAFAEYAGIHAIFGAFIVAIAIGDSIPERKAGAGSSKDLRFGKQSTDLQDLAQNIRQIVTNVFAPFFFANISLRTDFVANFSLRVTLVLVLVACLGKVLGATWGARLAGMEKSSALAVGFAMNARGAMEMVLGVLALRAGLIGERLFVALVIMALFTSLVSGPAIQALLGHNRALAANSR